MTTYVSPKRIFRLATQLKRRCSRLAMYGFGETSLEKDPTAMCSEKSSASACVFSAWAHFKGPSLDSKAMRKLVLPSAPSILDSLRQDELRRSWFSFSVPRLKHASTCRKIRSTRKARILALHKVQDFRATLEIKFLRQL